MNCPRCQHELKRLSFPELDDAVVHLCPHCEGAWYPQASLLALTQSEREEIEESALAPALAPDQLDKIDLDAPLDCPECGDRMRRFSYPLAPDTELDECPEHGMWLDDGELGVMLDQVAANQEELEKRRREVAKMREEMDMDGIAKGGRFNPIGMTLRLLNAIFVKRA